MSNLLCKSNAVVYYDIVSKCNSHVLSKWVKLQNSKLTSSDAALLKYEAAVIAAAPQRSVLPLLPRLNVGSELKSLVK